MALSVFDDKARPPRPADLDRELGRSATAWKALVERLARRYDPLIEEWVFSGAKWGWALRLRQKKRAILYLTPCSKFFLVGLVLGEKAFRAALAMGLPKDVEKQLRSAPKYAEGRGIRLEMRFKKDLPPVERLAEAKMSS